MIATTLQSTALDTGIFQEVCDKNSLHLDRNFFEGPYLKDHYFIALFSQPVSSEREESLSAKRSRKFWKANISNKAIRDQLLINLRSLQKVLKLTKNQNQRSNSFG
jgi:hypothetical protein